MNCGLLDEGTEALIEGLRENSSLKHLYLGGNGIGVAGIRALAAYIESGSCHLSDLSLSCNRLGDEGIAILCKAMLSDGAKSIIRLNVASCGIGPVGAGHLAALIRENSTLKHLDAGFNKMTAPLKEVANCMGSEGAQLIATALLDNQTLTSLSLMHNQIHQNGIEAIRDALGGAAIADMSSPSLRNTSIVHIWLEQMGVPFNELTREDIRSSIARNRALISPEDFKASEEASRPAHLDEVASVYRLNGLYSEDSESSA